MSVITVDKLSFSYPGEGKQTLKDITFSVEQGEFIILCGDSGCGKTTLLRCMKQQIAPNGRKSGTVTELLAADIGFVFQNPENQIVTDTVRHELAFGLENMGLPTLAIRQRVAETALFFGIDEWIDRSVYQISGGEKQLLNLAAVIAMRPKLLLLDEPTSQLDPVARKNFLELLVRVNRELGIAVLLIEHHLEELLPLADRVLYMEKGSICFQGTPEVFAAFLYEGQKAFVKTLPSAARIAARLGAEKSRLPFTVREGRAFLSNLAELPKVHPEVERRLRETPDRETCLSMEHIWFSYARQMPYVLKGVNLEMKRQTMHVILGGNGSGKTTLLSVLAKRYFANRGKIKFSKEEKGMKIGLLSQNPKAMFSHDSVREELANAGCQKEMAEQFGIAEFLDRHPYDLSGGEQQRVALAMVLAGRPGILLLDEPTKGLDPFLKEQLAGCLKEYVAKGGTVLCVTHDVEFAARYADVISLLFEGEILCTADTRRFFEDNAFYTTDAARIFRGLVKHGLLYDDTCLQEKDSF